MTPFPEPANWYFGPSASVVFVYVLPVLLAGGLSLRFALRALVASRRARDARRAADAESDTLDVGDTILRGRAELDDSQGAVRVTVEQEGREAESSGSWTVTWTEVERRTFVAPFYVVHASGERVRVEPGEKTHLAASLVATERVGSSRRRRVAEVAEGQEVWITGELTKGHDPHAAAGYRGSQRWVMRPARDGRMRVSTEQPETMLARQATRARAWSAVFAVLFAAMMLSHLQYHALVLSGRHALATVVDKKVISGDDSDSYELSVRASRAETTVQDTLYVSAETYNAWGPGKQFPAFVTFDDYPNIEPGDAPRALAVPTLAELGLWLVLAIVSLVGRPRAWHEGARVDESQSGRL